MMQDDPIPFIVEQVAKPVVRVREDCQPGKGVDLTPHEAALRELLRDVREVYVLALDDWQTRADPNKPKQCLEDNWPEDDPEPYDLAYDYKEIYSEEEARRDWDEHWHHFYYRPRGNPGKGRSREVPVTPLRAVYPMVRRWWLDRVRTGFCLIYPRRYEGAERDASRDMRFYNPAGRLFLLIAQELDHRYTARVCYGVYETVRKKKAPKRSVFVKGSLSAVSYFRRQPRMAERFMSLREVLSRTSLSKARIPTLIWGRARARPDLGANPDHKR